MNHIKYKNPLFNGLEGRVLRKEEYFILKESELFEKLGIFKMLYSVKDKRSELKLRIAVTGFLKYELGNANSAERECIENYRIPVKYQKDTENIKRDFLHYLERLIREKRFVH